MGEQGMIDLTSPEFRRLLSKLVMHITATPNMSGLVVRGRRRRHDQARLGHYEQSGLLLT